MCGIAGIMSGRRDIDIPTKLGAMAAAIKHRGPDDGECVTFDDGVGLAHVRLSILDVSNKGHQPMYSADMKHCITYNGEIYNFKELKNYLTKKYSITKWQSDTDTEVIIEGYAREGKSFIEKLNGIYSLAIKTLQIGGGTVFIARDPYGVKPLYCVDQDECVYFASEMKALTTIGLKLSLRLTSVQDQLLFMYVPEPYTMFKECTKFLPGEYRIYNGFVLMEKGQLSQEPFHHDYNIKTESDAIDMLDNLLVNAVQRQLISDVPVSMFLSGGLDSSLVAALTVKQGANIKDAYTISFSKEDSLREGVPSDDLSYAKIIANRLGLKLNIIEVGQDMLSYLPEVVYHLDDALSDPAAINTYLICRQARSEGVKVMLSGQGADEIFAGYRKYLAMKMYSSIPRPLAQLMKVIAHSLPNHTRGRINTLIRQSRKFADNAVKPYAQQMVELAMWKSPNAIEGLFSKEVSLSDIGTVHRTKIRDFDGMEAAEAMMHLDEKVYLPSHNLMYTDRMSMMAGVEARVPFLDFELVDFVHQLPFGWLLKGKEQKYILKRMAERYLPKEVIYRSKAGFSSPIRSWFQSRNELTDYYFSAEHITVQGIFNANKVATLYAEQLSGKADNAYLLYALLSFEIWHETFVEHCGQQYQ